MIRFVCSNSRLVGFVKLVITLWGNWSEAETKLPTSVLYSYCITTVTTETNDIFSKIISTYAPVYILFIVFCAANQVEGIDEDGTLQAYEVLQHLTPTSSGTYLITQPHSNPAISLSGSLSGTNMATDHIIVHTVPLNQVSLLVLVRYSYSVPNLVSLSEAKKTQCRKLQ